MYTFCSFPFYFEIISNFHKSENSQGTPMFLLPRDPIFISLTVQMMSLADKNLILNVTLCLFILSLQSPLVWNSSSVVLVFPDLNMF